MASPQTRSNTLSIFGFARIPILVYLGSKLDDGIDVALFQRQRVSGRVGMGQQAQRRLHDNSAQPHRTSDRDIVVLVSVSAPISATTIPSHLSDSQCWRFSSEKCWSGHQPLQVESELASFSTEYRAMLGQIERDYKPHADGSTSLLQRDCGCNRDRAGYVIRTPSPGRGRLPTQMAAPTASATSRR